MYTTLEMIKRHLNVDQDFHEDDAYIQYLYEVAEATVQVHLCVALEDLEDSNGNIPAPVVHAILLFIGDLYANREVNAYTSVTTVPFGYDYLISLYKNYSDTTSDAFYNAVLIDVVNRLEVEESTGRLVLYQDPERYVGIRGKAMKRIEEKLMVDAGRLYLQKNNN